MDDYAFCVLTGFDQIYATSSDFSWTNAEQFRKFCRNAQIRCDDVNPDTYFRTGMCDGAFLTEEYTYDAGLLRDYFIAELRKFSNVEIRYGARLTDIVRTSSCFALTLEDGARYETDFLLNATYAATNQIAAMLGYEPFQIKYELCEIILCQADERLQGVGITVMDGPFFSLMPFGKAGLHSLTSVTFTPHVTSYDKLPSFACQKGGGCGMGQLANCNECGNRPQTAWEYMNHLAGKYMKDELEYTYVDSLFSMKPILKSSEVDDSRPTRIRVDSKEPYFVSVLSGKINTVYDLEEYL